MKSVWIVYLLEAKYWEGKKNPKYNRWTTSFDIGPPELSRSGDSDISVLLHCGCRSRVGDRKCQQVPRVTIHQLV